METRGRQCTGAILSVGPCTGGSQQPQRMTRVGSPRHQTQAGEAAVGTSHDGCPHMSGSQTRRECGRGQRSQCPRRASRILAQWTGSAPAVSLPRHHFRVFMTPGRPPIHWPAGPGLFLGQAQESRADSCHSCPHAHLECHPRPWPAPRNHSLNKT